MPIFLPYLQSKLFVTDDLAVSFIGMIDDRITYWAMLQMALMNDGLKSLTGSRYGDWQLIWPMHFLLSERRGVVNRNFRDILDWIKNAEISLLENFGISQQKTKYQLIAIY